MPNQPNGNHSVDDFDDATFINSMRQTPESWLRGNIHRVETEYCSICQHYHHEYIEIITKPVRDLSRLNLIYGNLRRHLEKRHAVDPNVGELWLEEAQDQVDLIFDVLRKELHKLFLRETGRYMTEREFCTLVVTRVPSLSYTSPFLTQWTDED